MKGAYVYDEEHYPNFASFAFEDVYSKERHFFYAFWDHLGYSYSNIEEMMNFIHKGVRWLVGYNNKEYDDTILVALLSSKGIVSDADAKLITKFTYETSTTIINGDKHDYTPYDDDDDEDEHGNARFSNKRKVAPIVYHLSKHKIFHSLDLLLQLNRIDRISLKQLAIGMKWHRIMDLPIEPGSTIKRADLEKIKDYQWNDVDITKHALHTVFQEQVKNRIQLSEKTGLDLYNACDSDMAKIIMADRYCKAAGIDFETIQNKRTYRKLLPLKSCISNRIYFHTKELNRLYGKFSDTVIDPIAERLKKPKEKFKMLIKSKYLEHTIRLGGIHSNNPPEVIEESDKYDLIDLDVTSYYPRILVNEGYYPMHLGPLFTKVFEKDILDERIKAVKAKEVDLAGMLKITANSVFGQTNSIHSWMYDPLVSNSICINGQLYLLMLVEWLESHSKCIVVYSNTDGLTVRVPKSERSIFFRICKGWTNTFNFELKFTEYRKMILRDVNNYLIFTHDQETPVKSKGYYDFKKKASKGYKFPIIARSLFEYYDKGTPIEETVRAATDPYLFMRSEKSDPDKFQVKVDYMFKDGFDYLQKNNRWMVTAANPNQGRLTKVNKLTRDSENLQKDRHVTVVNDVDASLKIGDYKIDFGFYIDECKKVINLVSNKVVESHVKDKYVQTTLKL